MAWSHLFGVSLLRRQPLLRARSASVFARCQHVLGSSTCSVPALDQCRYLLRGPRYSTQPQNRVGHIMGVEVIISPLKKESIPMRTTTPRKDSGYGESGQTGHTDSEPAGRPDDADPPKDAAPPVPQRQDVCDLVEAALALQDRAGPEEQEHIAPDHRAELVTLLASTFGVSAGESAHINYNRLMRSLSAETQNAIRSLGSVYALDNNAVTFGVMPRDQASVRLLEGADDILSAWQEHRLSPTEVREVVETARQSTEEAALNLYRAHVEGEYGPNGHMARGADDGRESYGPDAGKARRRRSMRSSERPTKDDAEEAPEESVSDGGTDTGSATTSTATGDSDVAGAAQDARERLPRHKRISSEQPTKTGDDDAETESAQDSDGTGSGTSRCVGAPRISTPPTKEGDSLKHSSPGNDKRAEDAGDAVSGDSDDQDSDPAAGASTYSRYDRTAEEALGHALELLNGIADECSVDHAEAVLAALTRFTEDGYTRCEFYLKNIEGALPGGHPQDLSLAMFEEIDEEVVGHEFKKGRYNGDYMERHQLLQVRTNEIKYNLDDAGKSIAGAYKEFRRQRPEYDDGASSTEASSSESSSSKPSSSKPLSAETAEASSSTASSSTASSAKASLDETPFPDSQDSPTGNDLCFAVPTDTTLPQGLGGDGTPTSSNSRIPFRPHWQLATDIDGQDGPPAPLSLGSPKTSTPSNNHQLLSPCISPTGIVGAAPQRSPRNLSIERLQTPIFGGG